MNALKTALPCVGTGVLYIRVHEGKALAAHDSDGLSDPFCAVLINGEKLFETPRIRKSLNPSWDRLISGVDAARQEVLEGFRVGDGTDMLN